DWQILADLSFADLVLFCRAPETGELTVVAQMRPYTAQTIYNEDLVGTTFAADARPGVTRAFAEGQIVRDGEPDWSTGVPVREEAIPVPLEGDVIAVVTREANLSMVRAPSQLELTYLQAANELSAMLASGAFPFPDEDPERELAPRVGDGLMRLDPSGTVVYASPNAISAYRRLGVVDNVVGRNLGDFDLDDVAMLEALGDGEPLESEVEARGAVVLRRLLPLTRAHHVLGALVLIREVTELRRHERLLLYKDATIREIHHRVKNNLQTVASLLRLQSRRLSSEEARLALGESVRRISSIALVHETLSQDSRQRVSFDKVAGRLLDMLGTGLTDPTHPVTMELTGGAGELPAEVATPLALVLSELVQNSVEHAFPGRGGAVVIDLERRPASLHLTVKDDGVGIPEGWTVAADANLGLQIATTLVESELGGTLEVNRAGPDGGTTCEALLPLPR
ncbi:MAG: sensor histidine kinase, partial [Nitriliruptor sp.]|uniref:sensor histidine kinase n=1 Tax=Nitriliruptor sp. TaxID=2448056 RepID=UPI0034A02BD0